MMEVDVHSPSSTVSRSLNYSLKRSRSPGSPSQERQPKRPMLALEDGCLSLRTPTGFPSPNQSSTGHYQSSPEDWVRRAGDLSIRTPLSGGSPNEHSSFVEQDEYMTLDEPTKPRPAVMSSSPRPQPHPPAQRLFVHDSFQQPAAFPFPSSPSVITEPTDTRPLTPSTHILEQQPLPIYVQYHIVSTRPPNRPESLMRPVINCTLSETMMPVSPPRSSSGQVSPSGKKQRVTMGPRADCIKCKMSVRGHWMHFD